MYTQKMHEVQKHLTLSDHGVIMYAVIVNKKFWEGLPADVHKALQEAMDEASKYERSIAQKENDDALEKIKQARTTEVYVLPAAEKAAWRQAMLPLYKQYEGSVGKDNLDAIEKIVAESSKKK
jgi:C4-dicarboxylate-binding protein DctP